MRVSSSRITSSRSINSVNVLGGGGLLVGGIFEDYASKRQSVGTLAIHESSAGKKGERAVKLLSPPPNEVSKRECLSMRRHSLPYSRALRTPSTTVGEEKAQSYPRPWASCRRLCHGLIAASTVILLDTEQTVWTKPPSAPKLPGATPHRGCSRVLSGPSTIQWCGVYLVRRA